MFTKPDREWLRRFTQEDMLASGLRVALASVGPVGVIVAEFATQLVPRQHLDRLQNFSEQLNERLAGLEDEFRERLSSSAAFATLTEEASPCCGQERERRTAPRFGVAHPEWTHPSGR